MRESFHHEEFPVDGIMGSIQQGVGHGHTRACEHRMFPAGPVLEHGRVPLSSCLARWPPFLGVMAQLGVLLYMFTVGLELHPDLMRHRAHATVAISHTSILVPFMLGALL